MQFLDESSFGCDTFVDMQNAFDTLDHKTLVRKL